MPSADLDKLSCTKVGEDLVCVKRQPDRSKTLDDRPVAPVRRPKLPEFQRDYHYCILPRSRTWSRLRRLAQCWINRGTLREKLFKITYLARQHLVRTREGECLCSGGAMKGIILAVQERGFIQYHGRFKQLLRHLTSQ